jgi:hypothetical protein
MRLAVAVSKLLAGARMEFAFAPASPLNLVFITASYHTLVLKIEF